MMEAVEKRPQTDDVIENVKNDDGKLKEEKIKEPAAKKPKTTKVEERK